MKQYKVGLVGVSRGSGTVAPFSLYPETKITALCDLNETRLLDVAKYYSISDKNLYRDYDQLVNSDIDIVVVGTPIQLHAEQTVKALEAGKHVMSEVTMVASTYTKLEGAPANQMIRLLEVLEDLDDVQNVYSNFDMDAEQMEHAAG